MRGWENVTTGDLAKMQARQTPAPRAKYRNVKTVIGRERFDSRHEADDWLALSARQELGEISGLQRQVRYALYAPILDDSGTATGAIEEVASYIADFVFRENGQLVVQDSKGGKMRTKEYLLKRRWLERQQGIVIRET